METAPAAVSAAPVRPPFPDALTAFLVALNAKMQAHHTAGQAVATFTSTVPCDVFTASIGVKYVRILRTQPLSTYGGSAYAFIEISSGDILKPAGFKGPAKNGARGNIYNADPTVGCGPYGVASFRAGY
jgi:hypothetical protein